jgi:serine/threonine-protein kinase RsbW
VTQERGFTNSAPITRPAVLESLPAFQHDVAACAAREGLEPERAENIAVAVEEVLANICRYAYPNDAGTATLVCGRDGDDFFVEISDAGQPFDPSRLHDPKLDDDLDARPVGGLGWFLVRRMVDELQYHRQDGRNVVRLILRGRQRGER